MPSCTSMVQRTASTTLRNSMMLPSPIRFTTRSVMYGDGRIDQIAAAARVAVLVSAPRRSQPACCTRPSAARIAASLRVSGIRRSDPALWKEVRGYSKLREKATPSQYSVFCKVFEQNCSARKLIYTRPLSQRKRRLAESQKLAHRGHVQAGSWMGGRKCLGRIAR
jgi:hypothetical protein